MENTPVEFALDVKRNLEQSVRCRDQVTLGDIYRSIVPIVAIMILTLAIIMAFPQIALWLPQQVYGQ